MKLHVMRTKFTPAFTLGKLYIDDQTRGFTVEDSVRAFKIPGRTAIPTGTYEIATTFSPHFKRMLPLLIGVPGFEGIRIHGGNSASDTEGCVIVGKFQTSDGVRNCHNLVNWLTDHLHAPLDPAVPRHMITIDEAPAEE